jgi:endonuclease I
MFRSSFRHRLLLFLVAVLPAWAAPTAGYYNRTVGLTGGALKAALHDIIRTGHTVIPYAALHDPLARLHEDPANPANLILLYSKDSVPKGTDFSSWNREHAWPRSRGNSDQLGPDDSDLHYIWPAYSNVNSVRGNLYYDLSDPTDRDYRSPGHALAPQTSFDSDSWEPPPGQRGPLARCLFYVAVRYDGDEPNTSDMELVAYPPTGSQMGNLATLLRWHREEPVTDAERRRNDLIDSEYQHNRNPFIDRPEWVSAIWGEPLASGGVAPPIVSVAATVATAAEQPAYAGQFTVTANALAPTGGLTIALAQGGTASGFDVLLPPAVIIPAGTSSVTLRVAPIDDRLAEGPETVTLTLQSGAGYTIVPNATREATVTIHDSPQLPASWNFDAGAPFGNPLPADTGNATLDFSGWRGTVTSFTGTSGQALALVDAAGNDSFVQLAFSMLNLRALSVTFATRGTSTGFSTGTWSWSTDGSVFTALTGINTATTGTSFVNRTVDFSGVTTLNNAPSVFLRYTLTGATSSSGNNRLDDLRLSATPVAGRLPSAPAIRLEPASLTVRAGEPAVLQVQVEAYPTPTYQWRKNGLGLLGATAASLTIARTQSSDSGIYTVVVTNSAGTAASAPATLTVEPATALSARSRISNLSVRTNLAAGQTLVVGFVTDGAKPVLVRGVGPGMHDVFPQWFGTGDVMADPRLELYQGSIKVDENDNWNSNLAATLAGVGAFPLTIGSKDSSLLATINGPSTAQLKGTGSGVVLVDAYDTTSTSSPRLTNVSARNQVGTGTNVLIAGFVVDGSAPLTVLVRGIGPALRDIWGVPDALVDPRLEIFDSANRRLHENDNWDAGLAATFDAVGAYRFKAGSKDAALLLLLPPGSYTVQLSGVGGTTGDGVAEVYEVP